VEMFRLGNPCILRLAGNKICLRSDERLQIDVELVGNGADDGLTEVDGPSENKDQ
jgi:hypothetical protein